MYRTNSFLTRADLSGHAVTQGFQLIPQVDRNDGLIFNNQTLTMVSLLWFI